MARKPPALALELTRWQFPGRVSAATCHLTQSGERERGTDEAGAHNAGMGTGSARRDDVSGANIATAEIPLAYTAMGRITGR